MVKSCMKSILEVDIIPYGPIEDGVRKILVGISARSTEQATANSASHLKLRQMFMLTHD